MLSREETSDIAQALANVERRAADVLRSASDGWQAVAFIQSLHASLDTVSQHWRSADEKIECQPGCASCCSARVEVSDPEAIHIARHLLSMPLPTLETIQAKLRANGQARASSRVARVPCAFLEQGLCIIYEHRPAVCRKAHSLSFQACEQQQATIPQILGLVLQHEVLIEGTNRGYVANGLPANVSELSAAVLAVLEDPAKPSTWYGGRPLLPPAATGAAESDGHGA